MVDKITKKEKRKEEKHKPEKPKKWIGKIVAKMKSKGTLGKFSKEAAKEGESTLEHANEIKNSPKSSPKLKKEAQFVINMSKLKKKKK